VWPVFLVLIGTPLLVCFRELRGLYESAKQIDALWATDTAGQSWPGALLSASALLWVVTTMTYALAPSVYYDILNLHLPVIRYFASQHTLSIPPNTLAYAYYPQGVETVMTLGYSLGGQPAAQVGESAWTVFRPPLESCSRCLCRPCIRPAAAARTISDSPCSCSVLC